MTEPTIPYAEYQERWIRHPNGWEVWEWRDGVLMHGQFVPTKRRWFARFVRWFWQDDRVPLNDRRRA